MMMFASVGYGRMTCGARVSDGCLQVRILKTLKHPNVIEIYQFFEDDPSHYYVVIEYMRGGELFDRIVRKVRPRPQLALGGSLSACPV